MICKKCGRPVERRHKIDHEAKRLVYSYYICLKCNKNFNEQGAEIDEKGMRK